MILETIPSLNFYLFKVEDRKLFIPTVGDRKWGGGGGEGGRWQLPIPSPPFYFDSNSISNKAARKGRNNDDKQTWLPGGPSLIALTRSLR